MVLHRCGGTAGWSGCKRRAIRPPPPDPSMPKSSVPEPVQSLRRAMMDADLNSLDLPQHGGALHHAQACRARDRCGRFPAPIMILNFTYRYQGKGIRRSSSWTAPSPTHS